MLFPPRGLAQCGLQLPVRGGSDLLWLEGGLTSEWRGEGSGVFWVAGHPGSPTAQKPQEPRSPGARGMGRSKSARPAAGEEGRVEPERRG